MQHLLTLISIAAFFLFAGACACRVLFAMLQPEGMIEQAFPKWGELMKKWYDGKRWQQLAEKALGGCAKCTSFWAAVAWYPVYMFLSLVVCHHWVTDGLTFWAAFIVHGLWPIVIIPVQATLNYFFIAK